MLDPSHTLRAENEQLREQIRQMEELLGLKFESPRVLRLTGREEQIFGMLMKREVVTKDAMMIGIYGLMPEADDVDMKIIDVFVCKVRKKLAPFGIKVDTIWGRGYYMKPEAKAAANALFPKKEIAA